MTVFVCTLDVNLKRTIFLTLWDTMTDFYNPVTHTSKSQLNQNFYMGDGRCDFRSYPDFPPNLFKCFIIIHLFVNILYHYYVAESHHKSWWHNLTVRIFDFICYLCVWTTVYTQRAYRYKNQLLFCGLDTGEISTTTLWYVCCLSVDVVYTNNNIK